jgi:hypothetical protein
VAAEAARSFKEENNLTLQLSPFSSFLLCGVACCVIPQYQFGFLERLQFQSLHPIQLLYAFFWVSHHRPHPQQHQRPQRQQQEEEIYLEIDLPPVVAQGLGARLHLQEGLLAIEINR